MLCSTLLPHSFRIPQVPSPTDWGEKMSCSPRLSFLRSPILASPMHRMSCPSLHYLSSTVYIREYFGQSGKHSHQILFPKIYAQVQSDGTAASSGCCNWSRVS